MPETKEKLVVKFLFYVTMAGKSDKSVLHNVKDEPQFCCVK